MWGRKRRSDEDFADEVRTHIELETDRLIADGRDPREARDAARRRFGNVLSALEHFHESTRWVWLEQIAQDVRYAWRSLCGSPVFAATAVLTLAIGLGLVTVMFAVFNAYVLRPFAVRDPYRLYQVVWRAQDTGGRNFRWRDYEELRERRDLFDDVVAENTRLVTSNTRPIAASFVSGNYFDALGARLQLGRPLARFDASAPGASPVVVLSDDGWGRLFDRDPSVIGRPLDLNGQRVLVIGVTRPEFAGLDDTPRDLWLPLTMYGPIARSDLFGAVQPREMNIVVRLRRELSGAQMESALTPFVERVVDRSDPVKVEARLMATPNPLSVELLAVLSPVFAAFGLVLAASCANVSNMMLARAHARHRELGMRLSLGASRGRVVRQLLTEGLLIAVLSGIVALVLAAATLRAGVVFFFMGLPSSIAALVRVTRLDLDHRVFFFALALASLATTVFALMPALQATRVSLTDALRGTVTSGRRGAALRNVLVGSQVAVSLVLLVAAATLVRNGVSIGATNLGFRTAGIFSVKQRLSNGAWIPRAAEALKADARIGIVAVTDVNPLSERLPRMPLIPRADAKVTVTSYRFVSPEYFSLLRIPILRGRGFSAAEAASETPVAIVSAAGARTLWPGEDPIGKVIQVQIESLDEQPGQTTAHAGNASRKDVFDVVIVGIAQDIVSGMIVDGVDPAHLYLPTSPAARHAAQLLFSGRSTDDVRADRIQTLLRRVDADPLAFEVLPLEDLRLAQIFPVWAASWIGSVLGLIALTLSVSGLYGVLTYTLGQRTREIGIRMALGATAMAVVTLVMSQSARVAGLGAVAGLVAAFAALKLLSAFIRLQNVSLLDAGAFVIGVVLVAAATAVASYLPARRATRVDPIETLRVDV